jgi:hypothetical protein
MTILLAGHWVPFLDDFLAGLVEVSSGEQAGGSGLWCGPPTGLTWDASWASGFGSSCPFGSPG